MTGYRHDPVPATVPLWPKPLSIFGLPEVTTCITSSPVFPIPSLLAPAPPDAGRDTGPSRFGCQSGDGGSVVRGHVTARDLAAIPRRIRWMAQQVWSVLLARPSTLRPRVAVSPPHGAFQGHAAHLAEWSATLRPKGSSSTCIPEGVSTFFHTAFTAHSEARAEAIGGRLQALVRRGLPHRL